MSKYHHDESSGDLKIFPAATKYIKCTSVVNDFYRRTPGHPTVQLLTLAV